MYATMLETDYMQKETFKKNFWEDFKAILGKGHVVKTLEKCDFRDIFDHIMADRERKKAMTKEVMYSHSSTAIMHTVRPLIIESS